MNQAIADNSEILTALVTIIVGGIIRGIEKHRLRRKGKLNDQDKDQDEEFTPEKKNIE